MSSNRPRRIRSRVSLLIPIAGAMIGFIAALFLLRELDIFEGDPPPPEPNVADQCDYPTGYHNDVCQLVARASQDVAEQLDQEAIEDCLDGAQDACRTHREGLRRLLPLSEAFRDALFALTPPDAAEDWHLRYLTAVSALHSAYDAQFRALSQNNREAFLTAHERTVAAAEETGILWEEFGASFAGESDPQQADSGGKVPATSLTLAESDA